MECVAGIKYKIMCRVYAKCIIIQSFTQSFTVTATRLPDLKVQYMLETVGYSSLTFELLV